MLTNIQSARRRTFGVLGTIARASVVRTFGSEAETQSGVPRAFVREPAASSLVRSELVALVEGTTRRSDGEIPSTASIFMTQDFVGEADTVVLFALRSKSSSSIPSTRFIPITIDGFVVETKLFTALPPASPDLISARENAALGVSSAESFIRVGAQTLATEQTISNPFTIIFDVSSTRRFSNVLAEIAAAN